MTPGARTAGGHRPADRHPCRQGARRPHRRRRSSATGAISAARTGARCWITPMRCLRQKAKLDWWIGEFDLGTGPAASRTRPRHRQAGPDRRLDRRQGRRQLRWRRLSPEAVQPHRTRSSPPVARRGRFHAWQAAEMGALRISGMDRAEPDQALRSAHSSRKWRRRSKRPRPTSAPTR